MPALTPGPQVLVDNAVGFQSPAGPTGSVLSSSLSSSSDLSISPLQNAPGPAAPPTQPNSPNLALPPNPDLALTPDPPMLVDNTVDFQSPASPTSSVLSSSLSSSSDVSISPLQNAPGPAAPPTQPNSPNLALPPNPDLLSEQQLVDQSLALARQGFMSPTSVIIHIGGLLRYLVVHLPEEIEFVARHGQFVSANLAVGIQFSITPT
ncbi:hypothetical protein F5144DRAFT_604429 [Chaetomium tenue]|uniref:Uncharacterized protein n=1 Tax=Chaetomium tenue TaxID=1854479 RepID=A0ACB7P3G1_9PEZI|nr:hypothetical protein F5144DRAFT_604429 [Chaetomium globosum]